MDVPQSITQLVTQLHQEENDLRQKYFDARGAELTGRIRSLLEGAVADWTDETMTLDQAAVESGYSVDHLGRLIREGTLPNAGRPNVPRVRRKDLPLKRGRLREVTRQVQYAPAARQIALSVVTSKQ